MTFISGKTYTHEVGLTACFRQWRAESHCRYLHGYALSFSFEFEAETLDVRNWVVDFGSLKPLKAILEDNFDHKLLVAEDDPLKDELSALAGVELADVVILPAVGCEAFAFYACEVAEQWLKDAGYAPRVKVRSVTVREHGANWATYIPDGERPAALLAEATE